MEMVCIYMGKELWEKPHCAARAGEEAEGDGSTQIFISLLVRVVSFNPMAAALVAVAVVLSPLLALLVRAAWVALSYYLVTPLRVRRAMGRQGVHGPHPRPLIGNLRDVSALVARATADDMPSLSHDIVGRLMPHYALWSKTYGETR